MIVDSLANLRKVAMQRLEIEFGSSVDGNEFGRQQPSPTACATYGPLVIGPLAVAGAAATTAGEEEDRILALLRAHPVRCSGLVAAKAPGWAGIVVTIAFAT